MQQLTIFDELKKEPTRLTGNAKILEKYMYNNHFEENIIKSKELSQVMNINDRELRYLIDEVNLYSELIYIYAGNNGYWATSKENEIFDNLKLTRTKGSIKKLVKSNPKMLFILYSELNKYKEEINNA